MKAPAFIERNAAVGGREPVAWIAGVKAPAFIERSMSTRTSTAAATWIAGVKAPAFIERGRGAPASPVQAGGSRGVKAPAFIERRDRRRGLRRLLGRDRASWLDMAAPSSADPADPAAGVISFKVASEDGTATSGSGNDFTAVSVELTPDPRGFAANSAGFVQGSVDVDLTVLEDTAVEPGEALSLYLDEAAGFAAATWLQYRGADGTNGAGGTTRNVPVMIDDNDAAVSSVSVSSSPLLPLDSTSKGTYGQGETITFDAQFTSPVVVTGTPTFTFVVGTTDTTASYREGSGTDTLTFSYEVQASDADTDGISWAADKLALAGGTIYRQGTTTAATLTHTAQSALVGHKADGTMSAISAPQFAAATAARSVAENTASGNVGAAVAASDADGDTMYYSQSATGTSPAEREHLAAFNQHFSLNPVGA